MRGQHQQQHNEEQNDRNSSNIDLSQPLGTVVSDVINQDCLNHTIRSCQDLTQIYEIESLYHLRQGNYQEAFESCVEAFCLDLFSTQLFTPYAQIEDSQAINKTNSTKALERASSKDCTTASWILLRDILKDENLDLHDRSDAFTKLEALADQGHPQSINTIGYCYEMGIIVETSIEEATRLYHQAAELGNSAAMNSLATIYFEKGDGADQNMQEAVKLFEQSAKLGNPYAMNNLAAYLIHTQKVKKIDEAVKFLDQAAQLGSSSAMHNLAICFAKGEGVEQNMQEAIKLCQQAIDHNNTNAMVLLYKIYRHETNKGDRSLDSFDLLVRAAKGNNEQASQILESLYRRSNDTIYFTQLSHGLN